MELIFRVTDPLCGEPPAVDDSPHNGQLGGALMFFFYSAPEQTVEQTIETPVLWYAIALIMASL